MAKSVKKTRGLNATSTSKADIGAAKGRDTAERLKASGKTTRAKGHLSASTRRQQGKRDATNG